jgi:CubicO group peptidase (beta-lactamase class C family)
MQSRWVRTQSLKLLALAFVVAFAAIQPSSADVVRGRSAGKSAPVLVSPEKLGFAADYRKRLGSAMQGVIDKKHLAGVVTLAARHGQIVEYSARGVSDLESGKPMQKDAIMRIFSMTKPITGVAMMILYEEGKWQPSDPIAKHIPEFANLKVFDGMDADGKPKLVAPKHAPTVGELMSHNAGFTYGLFGQTPVDKMYQAANPFAASSLKGFIDKLAPLPLLYQPGEKWVYSVSVDIQGYLIEKLSGKTFPDFLQERIFQPLGMTDTAFYVPKEKMSRVATNYGWDNAKGALVVQPHDPGINQVPAVPSGGGGLYSTTIDYFRFAQMVLDGGSLDGVRILKPSSVAWMRTNKLNDTTLGSNSGIGSVRIQPALGFGYDFAVLKDPAAAKLPMGKNTYWWWGIANTWFWIDPTNDVVFVGLIQRRGGVAGSPTPEDLSRKVTYEALVDATK